MLPANSTQAEQWLTESLLSLWWLDSW